MKKDVFTSLKYILSDGDDSVSFYSVLLAALKNHSQNALNVQKKF